MNKTKNSKRDPVFLVAYGSFAQIPETLVTLMS